MKNCRFQLVAKAGFTKVWYDPCDPFQINITDVMVNYNVVYVNDRVRKSDFIINYLSNNLPLVSLRNINTYKKPTTQIAVQPNIKLSKPYFSINSGKSFSATKTIQLNAAIEKDVPAERT
ncbi:hypothetical protein GQX74_000592 [Glossina fuscipes]|nr:hypothetical protein GQX74_000592 [Glossina fuscipes]